MQFRPHHFLCTYCFQGKGYSPEFIDNYTAISAELQDNEQVRIEVVAATDHICSPCPHKREQSCVFQKKIDRLDQAHSAMLGIQPGDQLTWAEAKRLIKEKVTPTAFNQACTPCNWKKLGLCEQALFGDVKTKANGFSY